MKANNEVHVGRILELDFLTKSKAKIETNTGSLLGWSFEGKIQELQTNAFSFISDSLISLHLLVFIHNTTVEHKAIGYMESLLKGKNTIQVENLISL
jgi:hypothetical protein